MELTQQTTALLVRKMLLPGWLKNEEDNPQNEEVVEGEVPNLQMSSTFVGKSPNYKTLRIWGEGRNNS